MEKSTHALPPETVAKIAEMYADGYSFQEINEALDITSSFPRAKALRLADPTLEPRRQANIVARQQEKDKPVVDLFRNRPGSIGGQLGQPCVERELNGAIWSRRKSLRHRKQNRPRIGSSHRMTGQTNMKKRSLLLSACNFILPD